MLSESKDIRAAGYLERRAIIRERLGLYGNIATTAEYKLTGDFTDDRLKKRVTEAVHLCQQQHAGLRIGVRGIDTEKPVLVRIGDSILVDPVFHSPETNDTESEVIRLLSDAHSRPLIRNAGPNWSIIVLILHQDSSSAQFMLAFVISHSFADGRSGYVFHQSFLCALNNHNGQATTSTAEPPLPLEKVGKLKISWRLLLQAAANEYVSGLVRSPLVARGAESVWCGVRPNLLNNGHGESKKTEGRIGAEPRTCLKAFTIPNSTIQSAVDVCRTNNSRLTSLFNHFTAQAIARALRRRDEHYSTFSSSTAIDLRNALGVDADSIANYVSALNQCHHIVDTTDSTPDWSAVQDLTNQLRAASRKIEDQPVGLLKYVANFEKWLLKSAQKPPGGSFGESNIGVFDGSRWTKVEGSENDGDKRGTAIIQRIIFSQSGDGTGEVFDINIASLKDGPTSFVISWWPGTLGVQKEEEFMEEVGNDVLKGLEALRI